MELEVVHTGVRLATSSFGDLLWRLGRKNGIDFGQQIPIAMSKSHPVSLSSFKSATYSQRYEQVTFESESPVHRVILVLRLTNCD